MELYGSKVNEIEFLENKLQSEFDKFCSMKKPVLWPGMAFNWDVPGSYDNLFILLRMFNHLFTLIVYIL